MRNYRCRHGEVDLIMLDRDCLVFVEVRFRSDRSYTRAALTVDNRKQRKLARTAEMFLATRRSYAAHPARFDVIGVDRDADGLTTVEWLQDAFSL
jgi:putative endonuclease